MGIRILVTGGTGFIGQEIVNECLASGYEIAILTRNSSSALQTNGITILQGSLERPDWAGIHAFQPQICVHSAWIATPGVYINSPENDLYCEWSIRFAERIFASGLQKFIGVGTCLEYESSPNPLVEDAERPRHPSPYARAKLTFLDALQELAPSPSAWAWMRVFHAYGPGEHPNRFLSQAMRELSAGNSLTIRRPDDVVDYIHVRDIASAILTAMEPTSNGIYNVGSSLPFTVRQVALLVAEVCHAKERVFFLQPLESESRRANIQRLLDANWVPKQRLEVALPEMFSYSFPTMQFFYDGPHQFHQPA